MVSFEWVKPKGLRTEAVTITYRHFQTFVIKKIQIQRTGRSNWKPKYETLRWTLLNIFYRQIRKSNYFQTVYRSSPLRKIQQRAGCEWPAPSQWGQSGKTLCRCGTTWGSILMFLLDGKNIQALPVRQQLRRRALPRRLAGLQGFLYQR